MSLVPLKPILLDSGLAGLLNQCAVYEYLESAVAVVDADATLRYANQAFSNFNHAVRDAADNLHRHASLMDCPQFHDWLRASLTTGRTETLCQTFYYAPLIQVTLSVCARPVAGSGGKVEGVLLTLGEESIAFGRRHLARAQESLRSLPERIKVLEREKIGNDRLIRVLLRDAPFAMVLLNGERQIVQTNHAAERLFGISATQMLGQSCERILSCYHTCGGCPALEQRQPIKADEIDGLAGNQQTIPLLRSAVVLDEVGSTMVIEAFVDLTERKQAEKALNQLSEFNRLLVESTGEGIFSVDTALRCTFSNHAAASMLGYAPDELQGQDIHALFHGRYEDGTSRPRQMLPVSGTIEMNASQEADDVFWTKDGHAVPVQYLCNPLHDGEKVTGAVVVYRNVADARALAKKMDYLASHDPLTGLLNRRAFEQRLVKAMMQVHHENAAHMLCYIDLDQFKIVNDTCGHAAGDELLRQLSDVLHHSVRKSDVFARLGGDEFGLLLLDYPAAQAMLRIEAILAALAEYRFSWEGKSFTIGGSIGVVHLRQGITDASTALSAADAACYVAKDRGRNRIHVYDADDQDLTQRHGQMEWVSRIKSALEENRFALWTQPIVPVENPGRQNRHMEILLRMVEDGGVVNPGAFIPAAERYGLMSDLDRWVVRQTLAHLAGQPQLVAELELCCINLSGQSVSDEKFLDFLLPELARYPSVAPHICFEITETAAVANLSRASQFMRRVKGVGCHFALDDFGSGMSSFAYLKNLPVDFLKIDGNFVRDMADDQVDYAMVEAIHRVGSIMGIKTIAEFVEDEAILACLQKIGVDYAQGYGIRKPEPMETRY